MNLPTRRWATDRFDAAVFAEVGRVDAPMVWVLENRLRVAPLLGGEGGINPLENGPYFVSNGTWALALLFGCKLENGPSFDRALGTKAAENGPSFDRALGTKAAENGPVERDESIVCYNIESHIIGDGRLIV